jgi:CheY-like chemotaxis protein
MPTVLVVDDEPLVRELASRMLRRAGYATAEAAEGREAFAYLQRPGVAVDAILADVVMPGMTGTELLALVRKHWPLLPVVLMSAYTARDLRMRGLEAYAGPLLTKPFSGTDLIALLSRLLRNGHDEAEES